MRPALALVLLLAVLAPPLGAQTTPATRLARAASADVFESHLRYLADDLLEGRAPGTRGGDLAARYVAAQFRRLGLEPAGDSGSYFHNVPVIALTASPTLTVSGAATPPLGFPADYVLWSERDETHVALTREAVFAGYGIVAPEWNWNDYAGLDVRGKIVFCLVNDPGLVNPDIFRGKILTYYGRWTYKLEEARRQGAAGLIMIHTRESATYPWSTVTGSWTGEKVRLETAPSSLVVAGWIRDTAAAGLFAAAGQNLSRLMTEAARGGFRGLPLSFTLSADVRSTMRRSATSNVIGRYPGQGRLADEAVLIGGHYDHLGIRAPVDGDSIYNGAQDNASGTAAMLTAAEAFVRSGTRPQRSVLFMAFGAEESGLLGSEAFAERPTIPLAKLATVLNLDVVNLYGRTSDIAGLGADQSSLGGVFLLAAKAEGLRVVTDSLALLRGSFFRSDHFPFVRHGVPAISVEPGSTFDGRPAGWGEEQQLEYQAKRYHSPQDEILSWFNWDGAMQQIRVSLRTALAVADAVGQPTWNEGSEFRAAGEARRAIGQ